MILGAETVPKGPANSIPKIPNRTRTGTSRISYDIPPYAISARLEIYEHYGLPRFALVPFVLSKI